MRAASVSTIATKTARLLRRQGMVLKERIGSYRRLRSFEKHSLAAPLPAAVVVAIHAYWHRSLGLRVSPRWHRVYAGTSGILDHRYITREVFTLYIYPALNEVRFASAYSDKHQLDRMFPGTRRPDVVLRNIHGRFYDANYNRDEDPVNLIQDAEGSAVVVKPTTGSKGGSDVALLEVRGGDLVQAGETIRPQELFTRYGSNFIVERAIVQHDAFSAVYPHAVNTVRVTTLRHRDRARALSAVVRFGTGGRSVDNWHSAGVAAGVTRSGTLNAFAVDLMGRTFTAHPTTGHTFQGTQLPGVADAFALCERLHERLNHFDLVSWDVAIGTDEQPLLIEINLGNQDIHMHQLSNGPLFGELTEELMELVLSKGPA